MNGYAQDKDAYLKRMRRIEGRRLISVPLPCRLPFTSLMST